MIRSLILTLCFFLVSVYAAPEDDSSASKNLTSKMVRSLKLDRAMRALQSDEILEKWDSTGKSDPDIYVIFKKNSDGSRQLVAQLFDLNRDRKIDLAKYFERGKLVKVETDLDYDGFVDTVSEYDVLTGEIKKKTQADGATSVWQYYFKNELRKKELDRNADGKPDMWVYYRGGKISKTEVDQKFDGSIIKIDGPLNSAKGKKSAQGE